jgi:hypothetical protein
MDTNYLTLEERLAAIEARLAELEKHSHPPVDLSKPIYRAMARIMQDAADMAQENG